MVYYGRIKKIWDDLNDYDKMPKCSCHGCKCTLNSRLEKKVEDERVHQFLMGLDDAPYSAIRSSIIATDPLPNMNKVYSQVTEQEQVLSMTKSSTLERHEAMSFAVRTTNTGGRDSKGEQQHGDRPYCENCKRHGHAIDRCYRIIGFPEGHPGGRGRGKTQGGRGRGVQIKANAAQTLEQPSIPGHTIGDADKLGLEDLSTEDWNKLKSIINSCKSSAPPHLSGPHFEDADWSG